MLDLIWVDNQKVMVHYCVKEGLLLAILWVDNQKEMVHYFVKEGLLLAIFCPFYCKKRVYYSLHFFLHKDYFGRILSKIGLRNALCTIAASFSSSDIQAVVIDHVSLFPWHPTVVSLTKGIVGRPKGGCYSLSFDFWAIMNKSKLIWLSKINEIGVSQN